MMYHKYINICKDSYIGILESTVSEQEGLDTVGVHSVEEERK